MRHVSLHDTIDTPWHTPVHTRLFEHTPPYNNVEIDADTSELMHLEPLPHLILDLPNQALISNDTEIIHVQSNCSDHYAMILDVM